MFSTIGRLLGAATSTVEATAAVVTTTANAVSDATKRNATAGVTQLAEGLNYGLLALAETSASIAFEACQENDKVFAAAKIDGFSNMRSYLHDRMA